MDFEISVQDVKGKLDRKDNFCLLDIREPEEHAIAHIKGATFIPMGTIPSRLSELDPEQHIIVYCHHGMRSARVAGFLQQQGFSKVQNMAGGIDAWSDLVDPAVVKY